MTQANGASRTYPDILTIRPSMMHAFGGVPYGLSCDWDLIGIYYSDNSTHPCTFNFVMVEAELS
jgi:hypothetical protein